MIHRLARAAALGAASLLALASCTGDDVGNLPDAGGQPSDPSPDQLAQRGGCGAVTGAGTDHTGTITAPETWTAASSPHRIPVDLTIKATVTIEPCAVVLLAGDVRVFVGTTTDAGRLVAAGTSELVAGVLDVRPVTFDAIDPAAPWSQLSVEPLGTLDLAVTALQHGGHPTTGEPGALLVRGVAGGTNSGDVTRSAKLDRVLIEHAASYGLDLEGWGGLAAGSRKLWIRTSGVGAYGSAIRIEPGVAATLPSDLVVTGNTRDEILVRTSKAFMRDDTFADHGVPYRIASALYVNPSADGAPVTLTLEPGVTFAFEAAAGNGILVGSAATRQGVLHAVGTAAAPIVLTSAAAAKAAGDWSNVTFRATPSTGSRISYARIEAAGAESSTSSFGCGPSDNDSAVIIQGTGTGQGAPATAFIDHTTFDQIAGTTVIVSGWIDDAGPDFSPTNTFGGATPSCKVSRPRRTGAGDVCDGGRTTCWP